MVSFEEMISDPKATCRRLASVLEVDPEFYNDFEFEARNPTYATSSQLLHSLARSIGKHIPESSAKRFAKQAYMTVATSDPATKSKEEEQALQRLGDYYASCNKRLAEEFDINVSSWT